MKNFSNTRPVEILLVEDNEGDVFLTKEAFRLSKIANIIHVAKDGEVAMEFLRKEGEYKDVPTPDIVLLDINLPKKNGTQVLSEIKQDDVLRYIPVVILTSSRSEQDVVKSYGLHANSYLIKPVDFTKFSEIVSAIENFWFAIVVLPDEKDIMSAK